MIKFSIIRFGIAFVLRDHFIQYSFAIESCTEKIEVEKALSNIQKRQQWMEEDAMNTIEKVLKDSQNEKELMDKNYLKEFQRYSFCKFNLVIEKNGSGKTRMLRFLRDVVAKQQENIIIFLDCSESSVNEIDVQESVPEKMIFNKSLSTDSLENLFTVIKNQLPKFIISLKGLCQSFPSQAEGLLKDINKYLKTMMGRELNIGDQTVYIHNLNTGEDKELAQEIEVLSPGERNIVIFSLALLCIKININKPSLLLIDEIETHLHPAVLQELFKMLRDNLAEADCCVFIATHSIFLLPSFQFKEICYFEQGELKPVSGNMYRDILNTLVYGNEEDHSISELLVSVDSWSYAEFMAECFQPPTVSDVVKPNDPQYAKMNKVIEDLRLENGGEKLELLDFGAGDARIGMCMKMDYDLKNKEEWPPVFYHVYDKYHITEEFKSGEFVFGDKYESREAIATQQGKMDIVLMYNVLHEIGIDEWCNELNLAFSLLKENGVLIFSERKTLSIGEKPYGKSGYLLLGDEEVKALFSGMIVEEIELKEDLRHNTWGFAVRNINRKKITTNNIEKALERLKTHTQEKIDEYFCQENVNQFKARDYAFYCQQFFNVKEAQKILEEQCIPEMKFQFIVNRDPLKRKYLLQRRAEIDDDEGRLCRKYLEENPE